MRRPGLSGHSEAELGHSTARVPSRTRPPIPFDDLPPGGCVRDFRSPAPSANPGHAASIVAPRPHSLGSQYLDLSIWLQVAVSTALLGTLSCSPPTSTRQLTAKLTCHQVDMSSSSVVLLSCTNGLRRVPKKRPRGSDGTLSPIHGAGRQPIVRVRQCGEALDS